MGPEWTSRRSKPALNARPFSSNDNDLDLRVRLRERERLFYLLDHFDVDGVEFLGPVEGDRGDISSDLVAYSFKWLFQVNILSS